MWGIRVAEVPVIGARASVEFDVVAGVHRLVERGDGGGQRVGVQVDRRREVGEGVGLRHHHGARVTLGSKSFLTTCGPCGDLPIQHVQVRQHRVVQIAAWVVECSADLGQGKARAAKQTDPVEPPHIAVTVEPMTRRAAPRGSEQPDLVVVAHRSDRRSRSRGQARQPSDYLTWLPWQPR